MSSDLAVRAESLGKCYQIYEQPRDRLLQMLARGRRQYYREFWALRDVSFSVARGETVGIIGRNGSGKSTLLQMICGTVAPTQGVVSTHGRIAALLELGAGFNPEFTGRENVYLNAAIHGVGKDEMSRRMSAVQAFSELGEFLDQPVKTYSSGMYARLAFSVAINVDPEILIVDEALAVGDARFVAKCMARIQQIKEQGATILFVSHDVGSVRTLCNRAVWLDQGRLVEEGDVFPVTGRYMAFMFREEDVASPLAEDRLPAPEQTPSDDAARPGEPSAAEAAPGDPAPAAESALDARPVTHWGSHRGFIASACVRDAQGRRVDVHHWSEEIEVDIELCIPPEISRDHLAVAFSIKDLKGTDMIVSTTAGFGGRRLPEQDRFRVRFRMSNFLAPGKYLLVAAVETRNQRDVHYYEYIEGTHYFACLSHDPLMGLFQPHIEQRISVS